MLAIERANEIVCLLQRNGAVKVEMLAESLGVSEMTIRRDLEKMERDGLLMRCRGGAVPKSHMVSDVGINDRATRNMDNKQRMAQYCFDHFVQPNTVIYLDAGTTVMELAALLRNVPNLTVITNDVMVAYLLTNSEVELFILGGAVQSAMGCVHGRDAERQLENYRIDVSFVSSLVVNDSMDVFAATENKVYFRRRLIECSQKTYLLMDDSKFHQQSMFKINNLRDYTALITNKAMTPEEQALAHQEGIAWITV